MKNIIEYTSKPLKSFDEMPINDVDSLIFSTLSYIDYSQVIKKLNRTKFKIKDVPITLIKKGFSTYKFSLFHSLFRNVKNNPRYRELVIGNIFEVNNQEHETHFKAMTFRNEKFIYVSFMGTGISSHDWKEDFNMIYNYPVPAQKLSCFYLKDIISKEKGSVYVGGHSKGGNLAVYSSTNINILNKIRIKKIFNHDGPGFNNDIYKTFKFKLIKNKISKTVPSSSIIGMLMLNEDNYKIIKSNGVSIMQHNPFNWQIKNNDLIYLKERSFDSRYLDKKISSWIDELSVKEKKLFIDTIFNFLEEDNIDISMNNWFKILKAIYKGNKNMDKDTKEKMDIIYDKFIN